MTLARTAGFKLQRWTHVGDMLVSALLMVSYTFWQYCISIHENSMDGFTQTCTYLHTTHKCTCRHTHTHVHMHAYMHTTHTHSHTYSQNIKTFTRVLVCIIRMQFCRDAVCSWRPWWQRTPEQRRSVQSQDQQVETYFTHGNPQVSAHFNSRTVFQTYGSLKCGCKDVIQTKCRSSMPPLHHRGWITSDTKFVTLKLTLWGYTFVKVYVTCIYSHARWEL